MNESIQTSKRHTKEGEKLYMKVDTHQMVFEST